MAVCMLSLLGHYSLKSVCQGQHKGAIVWRTALYCQRAGLFATAQPQKGWRVWWTQIVGTAILWGGGTAIGEIPPYAFSYHAAKAGHRNDEFDRMFQVGWPGHCCTGVCSVVCM